MPNPDDSCATAVSRRRGRLLAYWNGTLWAIGTGLASGPLVIYLAMEFGAAQVGLGISAIKASPHLAGLFRLIDVLVKHDVPFVVIGGHAVADRLDLENLPGE
jgi:hypothetical protein